MLPFITFLLLSASKVIVAYSIGKLLEASKILDEIFKEPGCLFTIWASIFVSRKNAKKQENENFVMNFCNLNCKITNQF
jgi:predicted acyltransferase (DUF342 family)